MVTAAMFIKILPYMVGLKVVSGVIDIGVHFVKVKMIGVQK